MIQLARRMHFSDVRTIILLTLLAGLAANAQPGASIYADGLNNPRGLAFGHGNQLFVAEAGTGGDNDTIGICDAQVGFPLGPLTGGLTGRVSRLTPSGQRHTAADALPSARTSAITGREIFGATAVATLENDVYVLVSAGCTKGNLNQPSALYKIDPNGVRTRVADLSSYYRANPPAVLDSDHDPDGVPYALARLAGAWYVLNANHGVLDRIAPDGSISRVADFTPVYGHITPTAMAAGPDGNLYIANVGRVPHLAAQSILIRVSPDGAFQTAATGLTSVLGLAFDCHANLYALETAAGSPGFPPFFPAGTGRVVRYDAPSWTPILTGLDLPSGLTFGPAGDLFVTLRGHGQGDTPGRGRILRAQLDLACPER